MANSENNNVPIGTSSGEFLPNGQTIKDTALLDLVNKVQMYYGDADLSATAPLSPKGKIPQGTVTIDDINSVYIYQNYMYTITVTGAQLRKYLEYSVCKYYKSYVSGDTMINKNSSALEYNLDILQGADYTVDLTKAGLFDANGAPVAGGQPRITNLTYHQKEVQDNQIFKLAMNSYRFKGGGGFLAAAGIKPQSKDPKAINYVTFDSQKIYGEDGLVSNLIIRYFKDMAEGKVIPGKTSVEPIYDNNWRTVPRIYDLLNFTDLHGDINISPATGTPRTGAALISGLVNKERALYGDERIILTSSGDMMQGTAVSNILKGKPVIDIMNLMKFDSTGIGNHDFDWGIDTLNKNISNSRFPFLAANMSLRQGDTDKGSIEFAKSIKPWVIINKDGLKVGIIGVVNPDSAVVVSPSIINHFLIQDPASAINTLVPQIKSAGADIIIVLAHIGDQYNSWPSTGIQPENEPLSEDLAELAGEISGVTAILGGNSHTINYDLVTDASGALIPAVVSDDTGAGTIRLTLDENNKVISAVPVYLDIYYRLYSSLTPDSTVQSMVDSANQEIGPIINQVIASTEVDMVRYPTSDKNLDSNLGDWAADIIKNTGKADFAFLNYGGLRINIPKGNITIGQIWTLMPFDNVVNTMDMTGMQVKTILEYMVSGIKDTGHISGLSFTYDPSKPPRFSLTTNGTVVENPANSQITWISLQNGAPIDMAKTYKVAAPDFAASGGDYYPFPANSTNLLSTHVLVRDALIDDLKSRQTLNYISDGRIQTALFSTYQFIKPDFSDITANQQFIKDIGIKSMTVGNTGYLKARINITIIKPEGAAVEMLIHDLASNKDYDAAALGYWGPVNGMPIGPDFNITSSFKLKFSEAGLYTIRFALVDLSTNKEIMADSSTFTVINPVPTITTNLRTTATKDERIYFRITIDANNSAGKDVRLKITLKDQDRKPSAKLKYIDLLYKGHDVKFDKKCVAWIGTNKGFPLSDIINQFEIKFDKPSTYQYKFEIIDIEDYAVLASITGTVSVRDNKK